MIRIVIVDDHKLFRDGINSLLNTCDDFSVIGECSNGLELLKLLDTEPLPHIVLLDISMPEMTGIEVLEELKNRKSPVKCITLSMHEDGNYVVESVRRGAYGYLLKNVDREELTEAILQVYQGKKYFNREISEKMINNMAYENNDAGTLSRKEKEVLVLLSDGLTAKEIADKMIISTRTVETHRTNMMKKLDAKNSAELVAKAIKSRLI